MYGLVNQAVRGMVLEHHDEATWQAVVAKAGVDEDFVDLVSYDDADTYALVAAASEILNADPQEILRGFGQHWIQFTADEGYGDLVGLMGSTLEDFVVAIGQDLHGRVSQTMPELLPPSFRTERLEDGSFRVDYESHRQGLVSMVHGLLEGLGLKYRRSVSVELLSESSSDDRCRASFALRILD